MKILKNIIFMTKYVFSIEKGYPIISLLLSFFGSFSVISTNILIKLALDTINENLEMSYFTKFLILFIVYSLLINIINIWYRNIYSPQKIREISNELHNQIFKKSLRLPVSNFDSPEFLNKYSFILNSSEMRSLGVINSCISLFSSFFIMSALVLLISTTDIYLILIVIAVSLVNICVNLYSSRLSYAYSKDSVEHSRKMNYVSRIFLLKDYAKELRTSKINRPLFRLFDEGSTSIIQLNKKYGKKQGGLQLIQNITQTTYTVFIFLYLINKSKIGLISAGSFAMLFNSANQLSQYFERIMQTMPEFYQHSLYIDDFKDFINYPEFEDSIEGNIDITEFKSLTLRGVSFKYINSGDFALKNISMRINRGDKIALVGLNGAGKSTLTQLILRLYKPNDGEILINDILIDRFSSESLYQIIGALFQDFKLYSIPILENIILDLAQSCTDDRMIDINQTLASLKLKGKIEKLPQKINTYFSKELNSDGANFSGGEMQKVALSRILTSSYQLLILDEPSSALDAYSEAETFETICKQFSEETIIFISHRLSNIKNVDKIYFLEDGEIIELGTHEQLMKAGGKYAELYQLQLEKYL